MARDTKKPRSSGGGNNKGGSLLTGLLLGLIVGIAAAVGVAFYINRGASPFGGKTVPDTAIAPVPAQPPASTAPEVLRPTTSKDEVAAPTIASDTASAPQARRASGADRFDFYTMLPGQSDKGGKEARPVENKKPEASSPAVKKAWLQAGAFQNEQDADNLKAKLALIGIEARIQTQEIPGKGLWHRVRVGPFSQAADIEKARAQLHGNGIESTVVKSD